jgi:hypothetical protein
MVAVSTLRVSHIKSKVWLLPSSFLNIRVDVFLGEVVESEDNPFGEPSSFVDPLALPDACNRDIPFLTELGVNAIRVYSVNSSLNHDGCMSALSNAGIYTM